MRLSTLLGRAARLRCPACGDGRLFRGWFRMHPRCQRCGFSLDRESGFWLGSIYFNYGLTALIVTAAYFILHFAVGWPEPIIVGSLAAFCVLFPLWFFRYARSAWIAVDLYFDPAQASQAQASEKGTVPFCSADCAKSGQSPATKPGPDA